MCWCAATSTAPNAIKHPNFKAYVAFVSDQRHKAPTRSDLMLALTPGGTCSHKHNLSAEEGCVRRPTDGRPPDGRLEQCRLSLDGIVHFRVWSVVLCECMRDLDGGHCCKLCRCPQCVRKRPARGFIVREPSQKPHFQGCAVRVPCAESGEDQVKQVNAIKRLLALAQRVVDVFRIQPFRKIFLRHALPAEHSLALTVAVLLLPLLRIV
jgi:hypothetical protein